MKRIELTKWLEKAKKAIKSDAFSDARKKAKEYLKDPELLNSLIKEAVRKTKDNERKKNTLDHLWESLKVMFRLVRAYIHREYTVVPYRSMVLVVAAIIYFVSPFDLTPDWLPIVGFLDDATVIAWVYKSVKEDIDEFKEWERGREGVSI